MLYNLLMSRRSIRKFRDIEVEKEKVDAIIKNVLLSPSSRSIRPWEFIAVTDKGLLHKLSRCREHGSQFLEGAPLGIVVIADTSKCDVWIEDASIASIIIQLSAQDLGLGSCWIQVRERYNADGRKSEQYIKDILGIPSNYGVECMVAVGYPAEDKKPYDESELLYEKIHNNRF